jgi:hypothetical protein
MTVERRSMMNVETRQLLKMYLIALILILIAERIGLVKWQLGIITIVLVPFFHTIYLGVVLGPKFLGRIVKVMDLKDSAFAGALIVPAVYALMARYGTLVGPNVPKLFKAGIALILQEIGNNWGSIVIALPIGVLIGLRREVIGACYSVCREPNLSLIADIYGMDTPEGRGAIGTYITGTVLGTAFFSIIGSLFVVTAPMIFHPLSLGMAMGIGSASMMTAGATTLAMGLPQWKDEILAFAVASNLITGVTGVYASWLLGLPFANWVYRLMGRDVEDKKDKKAEKAKKEANRTPGSKINVGWTMKHVLLIAVLTLLGNWVATKTDPWTALPGMLILLAIVLVGLVLTRVIPIYVPAIAYISTIALILTIPGFPYAKETLAYVNKVNFLALATPIIAFTSLSIAKDLDEFLKIGWRVVVAGLITLFAVFFSAAVIAEVILRIQGYPR